MKYDIPAEWLRQRAHLEDGVEVGVGQPPNLRPEPTLNTIPTEVNGLRLAFGHFVRLLRRSRNLSVEQLARDADLDPGELMTIEEDNRYEPEPSTVYGLAEMFGLPPKRLIEMAGLAIPKTNRLSEAAMRFAANSKPVEPLSPEEQSALEVFVQEILSDAKDQPRRR